MVPQLQTCIGKVSKAECEEVQSFLLTLGLGIVHGDLKPENVLIFKGTSGAYTAKVTDFGYSNIATDKGEYFYLPKSWPWNAPEHHHRACKLVAAQKMDIFSFGMLCLWIMFEKCLSGTLPLPSKLHELKQYFQNKDGNDLGVLENLKSGGVLMLLAKQLVGAEDQLDKNKKRALQFFFENSLEPNQDSRTPDLRSIYGYFIQDQ